MENPNKPSPATALLAGTIDYAQPGTVFSDLFAPIALSPAETDHLGIHRLFFKGLGTQGSSQPTLQPFARVFLAESDGSWQPLGIEHRSGNPAGWMESASTDAFAVVQEVFFTANHTAKLTWKIHTTRAGLPSPRLCILGAALFGQGSLSGRTTPEGLRFTVTKTYENWFLKRPVNFTAHFLLHSAAPLPAAGFLHGELQPYAAPQSTASLAASLSAATPGAYFAEVPLTPSADGEGWQAQLIVTWDFQTEPARADSAQPFTAEDARARWSGWLAALPTPRPATHYWRRRQAQSFSVLVRSATCAPGYGAFSDALAIPATATTWASLAWFWDHFFAASTLGVVNAEWQTAALRCFSRQPLLGRMTPGIILAHPEQTPQDEKLDCYAPIATWSLAKTWRAGGPRPALSEIYPGLLAIHESWFTHCDRDGDGIPEWRNAGNPADDSPLYDAYSPAPGKTGNFDLPPFISVNLCSYLLMDARLLAGLADEQDLASDAARLRTRAALLEKTLLERCWDEADAFFYDLTPTGEKTRVKTFFGLLPLWAGVALPNEKARRAIEAHLLNPREFWGPIPFPSVAYNEPTYDAAGYWRGRTWPHVYVWNTEILHAHGYTAEAEQARDAFLRLNTIWPGPMENAPSDPAKLSAHVLPNYIWGAAALHHFLADWHHQPLAPRS